MAIVRLDIAYDGAGFHGYARQDGLRTVQGELEGSLEKLLDAPVETVVAGRTDAGVHARGQVVSFRVEDVDVAKLRKSLNSMLSPEVAIRAAEVVSDDFHARFSAQWRRYRYRLDQSSAPDPLSRNQVWAVGRELDVAAMSRATGLLLGEHDFSSFCRAVEGRSNVRRLIEASWDDRGEGLLDFWVRANSFCQQMVRSIVGFCYDVGRGFTTAETTPAVMAARDRSHVATVAPPHGLILWEVGY